MLGIYFRLKFIMSSKKVYRRYYDVFKLPVPNDRLDTRPLGRVKVFLCKTYYLSNIKDIASYFLTLSSYIDYTCTMYIAFIKYKYLTGIVSSLTLPFNGKMYV